MGERHQQLSYRNLFYLAGFINCQSFKFRREAENYHFYKQFLNFESRWNIIILFRFFFTVSSISFMAETDEFF